MRQHYHKALKARLAAELAKDLRALSIAEVENELRIIKPA
jgi:protein required for attachment to host cells